MSDQDLEDVSYEDLIQAKYVLDSTGRCHARCNGLQSILHCAGVKSERGLYRVWISNLQKMIRRGKMHEALTSMIECVETGKVFESNVINRLAKVIVSEDIGLACPRLPLYATSWLRQMDVETDQHLRRKLLMEMVEVLTLCEKSRLVDTLFLNYRYQSRHQTSIRQDALFSSSFEAWKSALKKETIPDMICFLNECIETSQTIKKTIHVSSFRKRQEIYYVWQYLFEYKVHEEVRLINEALLYLYIAQETNGGRKLNLIQACLNVIFAKEVSESLVVTKIPKGSQGLEWVIDEKIWPWSISYDKHSIIHADRLGRDSKFFFTHGVKLANRTQQSWLRELEEVHQYRE